jgi:hypothetical protein
MSLDDNDEAEPISLAERRAQKHGDASKWAWDDCLKAALRDLSAAEIKPTALIVCWIQDGVPRAYTSSPDGFVTVALLDIIKHRTIAKR